MSKTKVIRFFSIFILFGILIGVINYLIVKVPAYGVNGFAAGDGANALSSLTPVLVFLFIILILVVVVYTKRKIIGKNYPRTIPLQNIKPVNDWDLVGD